jgi:hypothetical protein
MRLCAQTWIRRASAREHSGDDEGCPDRPAARHGELPEREREDEEAGEGGGHFDEREGEGVVAGRVALDHHDLQRLRQSAGKHKEVARERAGVEAGEQGEPGEGERHARPDDTRRGLAEEHEREQRRQDDIETHDETGARAGRPLQARRLQGIPDCGQRPSSKPARAAPRPSEPTRLRPGSASTAPAIAKRTARNAKSG